MDAEKHAPKVRETTVRVKGREYPRVIVDFGIVDGARKRKTFKTRSLADKAVASWEAEQKILTRKIGEGSKRFLSGDVQDAAAAMSILGTDVRLSEAASVFDTVRKSKLTQTDIQDAAKAVERLAGKTSLENAAAFFMERNFPEGGERNIGQLVEDYIASRQNVERRADTIRDIRGRLGCATPRNIERQRGGTLHVKAFGFAKDFADTPVAHVSTTDLERWMERHAGKNRYTKRNMRVHLVALFNFAKERKFVRENPAAILLTPNIPKREKRKPYVMAVEDVEKAMRYVAKVFPEMVPYMALCMFAGIRPTECTRLDWKQINFDRKEIEIVGEVSKTGDERFVEMSDNLIAWLMEHRKPTGAIYFSRDALAHIRQDSGVRWTPDCMRHSFGSYHMAQYDNAGKTALQMGHREIDTTFEHYRRAVRKEDAARFWQIVPEGHAGAMASQDRTEQCSG